MTTEINTILQFAGAVRGRRQQLGLSQAEVARRAHVSRQWVSEFESGKATAELQLVLRLFGALDLRISLGRPDELNDDVRASSFTPIDLDELLDRFRAP